MKIKLSELRKIIREVLSEDGPKTIRGVAPQNRGRLDPGDVPPGTVRGVGPDSGSIDVLFDDADAEGERGPMTMRGLGLGGDEVFDTRGDHDFIDVAGDEDDEVAPETQRSPQTHRGMGPKRPDADSVDDLYSDWN